MRVQRVPGKKRETEELNLLRVQAGTYHRESMDVWYSLPSTYYALQVTSEINQPQQATNTQQRRTGERVKR